MSPDAITSNFARTHEVDSLEVYSTEANMRTTERTYIPRLRIALGTGIATLLVLAAYAPKRLYAQSIPEIAERVSHSVVMIQVYDVTGGHVGQGSGLFLTEDGFILTNDHVLKGAYSAEVTSDIGTFDKVTLMFRDEDKDLALLSVPCSTATVPSFASDSVFLPGQRVIAIGNPYGLEKTVSDGLISAVRRADGVELIQSTVPISPGSSGGVLLSEAGDVIGVTSSSIEEGQNLNFAVSLNTIVEFLDDFTDRYPEGTTGVELMVARSSVWYRVALKWIVGIVLVIIAALFGGVGYFALPLLMIAGYIVYLVAKGAYRVVSYLFRRRDVSADNATRVVMERHRERDASLVNKSHELPEAPEVADSARYAAVETASPISFDCSGCGHSYLMPHETRGLGITCVSCGEQLVVPLD